MDSPRTSDESNQEEKISETNAKIISTTVLEMKEGTILEKPAITTTVHEMKVKNYHLVEKKQETLWSLPLWPNEFLERYSKGSDWSDSDKMTLLIHSRSISKYDPEVDDCPFCKVVQENIVDGKTIRTEAKYFIGEPYLDENEMTQESLQRFEETWLELWKPQDWKSENHDKECLILK